MLAIDNLAYKSKISKVNPRAKLCFALAPLIIVLTFGKVEVSVICILIMSLTTLKFSNLSAKKYLALMSIPLGFLLMGTVTIMVGRHAIGTNLLFWFEFGNYVYGISSEALSFGMALVLRALASLSCMYFISLNTPMTQLFALLRSWKVPSLIISLMELIYRYIFVVLEEADRIFVAQSSRGLGHNFASRLRAFGELIASLLRRSLDRSNRIVAALEARGYDGNFYVLEQRYDSGKTFYVTTVIFATVLLILGFWR